MKLKHKYIGHLSIFFILCFIIMGIIFFNSINGMILTNKESHLLSQADTIASEISYISSVVYNDVISISKNPYIIDNMANSTRLNFFLLQLVESYEGYEEISILTVDGFTVASTSYNNHGAWAEKIWFQQSLSGKTIVSNTYYIDNSLYVDFVSPIFKNEHVIGVVALKLPVSYIVEVIESVNHLNDISFILLNNYDMYIYHQNSSKLLEIAEDYFIIKNETSKILNYKLGDKDVVAGYSKISSTAGSQNISWKVILSTDKNIFLKLINNLGLKLLFLLIFIGVFILVVVNFFFEREINRPLKELKSHVLEVTSGKLDTVIISKSNDELGDLANSINILKKQLKVDKEEILNQIDIETTQKIKLSKALHKLQELDDLKDNFLSNISHELRTPLTSIKSYNQLLHSGVLGKINKQQKESLGIILQSTEHLIHLINNLLDLSRYESGRSLFKYDKTDIVKLINDVLKEFAIKLKNADATINFKTSKNIPKIILDEQRIRQIIFNLLSNSVKYKEPTRKLIIELNVKVKSENIVISFKDNGMGIGPKDLDHIFDKFYQVQRSLRQEIEGHGIGLSIVKCIVDAHKGHIEVTSEEGKWTKTEITISINGKRAKEFNCDSNKH